MDYLCTMRQTDYLIVGQGIAGSVLAVTLMKRGKSVIVIDKPERSSSSKVAAGIYNPFNFRRMMNNWMAKELIRAAKEIYGGLETYPGQILQERNLTKIFSSADERRQWENACLEKTGLMVDEEIAENPFPEIVDAPYGIGTVTESGNVDTNMMMYLVGEKLKEQHALFNENFDFEKLELTENGIIYDERIAAGKLVFCEGYLVKQNPYFSFLPIRPVKGETLHVHIPGLHLTNIMNRGVYLLPQAPEFFTAGSTFENDIANETPSEKAETEIVSKLKKFIHVPIRVESRFAGVRPAVQDRRPVLGKHPKYPQLSVLNGFGSKGVLLAPWLSEKLADLLEDGIPLPEEVRIERYVRLSV